MLMTSSEKVGRYLATIFAGLLVLTGCTETEPPTRKTVSSSSEVQTPITATAAKSKTHVAEESRGQRKPGAEILFIHDFDGQIDSGIPEQVTLRFEHNYGDGDLTIQLDAESGMELMGNSSPYTFILKDSAPAVLPITLTVQSPGKYYLNIFATFNRPNVSQGRAFALAVSTSDYVAAAKKKLDAIKNVPSSSDNAENIILLPAQETISTK